MYTGILFIQLLNESLGYRSPTKEHQELFTSYLLNCINMKISLNGKFKNWMDCKNVYPTDDYCEEFNIEKKITNPSVRAIYRKVLNYRDK